MIRDVDRGARAFRERLAELGKGVRVSVGVHEDVGVREHPSGGTVAGVAGVLELGTDSRAPVGFLRSTIDEQRAGLARRLADAGARVLEGETYDAAFGDLAEQVARDVRARVPVDTATVQDAVEGRVTRLG